MINSHMIKYCVIKCLYTVVDREFLTDFKVDLTVKQVDQTIT